MLLVDRQHLLRTGPVDHADWNYRRVIGKIQQLRFRLILRLIGSRRFGSLLEIGYGSGIFMPELAARANRLAGIDIHQRQDEVAGVLARRGIAADLRSASMTDIPFPDASFDCAVAVSAMEFVEDIDRACLEIRRVLRPGGQFLVVTPGKSPLLDFGLWVLTRQSAEGDFAGRRERVVPALERHFAPVREIRSPRLGHQVCCLYRALAVARPEDGESDQSIRQAESELPVRT